MIIDIDIPQKIEPEYKDKKTLTRVKEVYDLPEVQAIKGAVQEHLLFIGVDGKNNIKTINLLGIGDARSIIISPKYILRSAIINNCEKVVLVHNHPSNSLKASKEDKEMSVIINNLLNFHGISLLDHIIVTEEGFYSMGLNNDIDYEKSSKQLDRLNINNLKNENDKLKEEIKQLKKERYVLFEKYELEEEY